MPVRSLTVALLLAVGLTVGAPGAAGRTQPTRTWRLSLVAPVQLDFALAELSFPGRPGLPTRVRLAQPPGLLYVAAAAVRHPPRGGVRLLVLSVNERPRGSLAPDPASVDLRVTGPRRLGPPSIGQFVNAFYTRPAPPSLCGLGAHHGAGDLRVLLGAGRPLAGFGAAAAVAQAYDVTCRLPSDPAFARAVQGCANTLAAGCCPPNAMCAVPAPAPAPACPPCPRPPCGGAVLCPLGGPRSERVLVCPLPAAAAVAC